MKKIIYNEKLRKMLLSIFIIIVVINCITPSVVYGLFGDNTETATYSSWISEQNDNTLRKSAIKKDTIEYIATNLKGDFKVNNQTINFTGENGKEAAEKIINDIPDKITITGKLKIHSSTASAWYTFEIDSLKIEQDALDEVEGVTSYTYNEYKKVTGKKDDEIKKNMKKIIKNLHYQSQSASVQNWESADEYVEYHLNVILEDYSDKKIIRAKSKTDNYEMTDVYIDGYEWDKEKSEVIEEVEEDDSADNGGILLSPFIALFNFVADAITSNLETIMTGKGLTASGVFKVLTASPSKPVSSVDDSQYYQPDIDMEKLNAVGTIQYPNISYTPEAIFTGQIDLLSIDFITGTKSSGEAVEDEGWLNIRNVISQWYQILRMIAIIGLLSVLIYTGIKIIISSNAKDKAKYKEWIINWIIAVAILFFMHYIMAFIISITGELSNLISNVTQKIVVDGPEGLCETNLMGLVRYMVQAEKASIKIGYEAMYIALLWYTIKFTFVYLKRVLNMAFLTLIAPIVALTYPIDKMNDGKAQGLDMWLKEYIFNALLQPMHCVLYFVLVGSAVSIAANNPIYGIVVLAFMTEGERLLKKIFGFDKASGGTVGGMGSAFAAGALASNIAKMAKLPKGNAGKGGAGGEGSDNDIMKNLKPTEKDSGDDLFMNSGDNGDNSSGGNSDNNDGEKTAQQRMLDAYDEDNFGTSEYDSAEREAMARDAYQLEGHELDDNAQREMLREQGWSEEDINDTLGVPQNDTGESADTGSATQQNNIPIRQMAGRVGRGMKNVGKKIAKPVWDFDHKGRAGAWYNVKRLSRKVGRAYLGAGMGIAAAAVQAGISITDGKYNPMEGIAAFSAGYAGGGQIAKGIGGLKDAFVEGTLSDDPKERQKELMDRATKTWSQRDDVIKHNNNKYSKGDRESVLKIQESLLKQGVTDMKEMDNCIKYIKASNNGSLEGYTPDMVRKSRVMHDFAANSDVQKVMFDPSKRKDYINTVAKNDNEKKILENKFKEVVNYHNIVNKK